MAARSDYIGEPEGDDHSGIPNDVERGGWMASVGAVAWCVGIAAFAAGLVIVLWLVLSTLGR